jgi:uncharacterized metal-binding protein YceD (DUF177 family)
LQTARSATAAERAAIASALDLLSCDEVEVDYAVQPLGGGHYRLSGALRARLTQRCVVTLEPVPQAMEESFDLEFCPPEGLPETGEEEVEALGLPEIEPLEHGSIAVGRVVFELISAALDPYPRKAGARFQWEEPTSGSEAAAGGPFAALKKLKDKR